MNRLELKMLAKQQIKGKIGSLFICTVIVFIITAAASILTNGLSGIFVIPPMSMGIILIYLKLADTDNDYKPEVADTFNGFNIFGKSVFLYLLTQIFTFLWMLLLIVPGFIKSISYSMSQYILAENPDLTAREALNRSKQMMYGHKKDYFVLVLSFIPWSLLTYVTLGFSLIYVIPYINMTMVNFYNKIKEESQII